MTDLAAVQQPGDPHARPGNRPRCTCDSIAVPGFPCRPWCATQHQHPGPECPGLCEPEESNRD